MSNQELVFLSATQLSDKMREKQISPVEVVKAYLDRIAKVDVKVNAYITILEDEALEEARVAENEITSGLNKGPLHGVPVGIKDQIYTKGIRTSSASRLRADFVPDFDAAVVTGLKRSGADLILTYFAKDVAQALNAES